MAFPTRFDPEPQPSADTTLDAVFADHLALLRRVSLDYPGIYEAPMTSGKVYLVGVILQLAIDADALRAELLQARSDAAIAEEREARLVEALRELDQRLQVQSVPLVEAFNIIAAGGKPTEDQLRKAQHAYKWAIYGSSIAAQVYSATPSATELDSGTTGAGDANRE